MTLGIGWSEISRRLGLSRQYNWHLPALGNGAADANPAVGSISGMFDFRPCAAAPLFLSPSTGEPVRDRGDDGGRCPGGRAPE